jgi:exodeoxyribonuclease VII large subunit
MQELADINNARSRATLVLQNQIERFTQQISAIRSRPALANPALLIDQRLKDNSQLRMLIQSQAIATIKLENSHLRGSRATLRALSPQGTLERGFSIVRKESGEIIRNTAAMQAGAKIRIRVSDGEISATVTED